MTLFDYTVLLIIGLSVVVSVMRGAVRELLALLGWVLAGWLAVHYSPLAAAYLPAGIPDQGLRLLAGFIAIFALTLLLTTLVSIALSHVVKSIGLGGVDRAVGLFFGLVRGLVVVMALVIGASLTTLPQQPFWQTAMFSAPLEALALSLKPWLPVALANQMKFN